MATLKVGAILEGEVVQKTHFGVFVRIEGSEDAFLHLLGCPKGPKGIDRLPNLGDRIRAKIVSFDKTQPRLALLVDDQEKLKSDDV